MPIKAADLTEAARLHEQLKNLDALTAAMNEGAYVREEEGYSVRYVRGDHVWLALVGRTVLANTVAAQRKTLAALLTKLGVEVAE